MGIDYKGALVVGYTEDELGDILLDFQDFGRTDKELLYEFAEELEMSVFHPYYDSDLEVCIYGMSIAESETYSATEVSMAEIYENFILLKQNLVETTGYIPSLYIMSSGY